MADHRATSIILAFLFLFIFFFKSSNAAGIVVAWGQSRYDGSLNSTCATGNYQYVSISLGTYCNPRILYSCRKLGAEIKFCQSLGVKIVLNLQSRFLLSYRNDDPLIFGDYIIGAYLGGYEWKDDERPFGKGVVVNGIDFGAPYDGDSWYYSEVARRIREYGGYDVSLAASPGCQYPDYTLGPAINDGLFDYLWVQFFNNPRCQYDPYSGSDRNLVNSWMKWTNSNVKEVYMGLPAAPEAAWEGGYIPPNVLMNEVLPTIQKSPIYGGVMLWTRYYDINSGYSNAIKGSVIVPNNIAAS